MKILRVGLVISSLVILSELAGAVGNQSIVITAAYMIGALHMALSRSSQPAGGEG